MRVSRYTNTLYPARGRYYRLIPASPVYAATSLREGSLYPARGRYDRLIPGIRGYEPYGGEAISPGTYLKKAGKK